MCVQDPNPSLQNRHKKGAQKDQRVPALAPDLRFVLAFHLSLVARETQQITPVPHVTKSQTNVKDYNKS